MRLKLSRHGPSFGNQTSPSSEMPQEALEPWASLVSHGYVTHTNVRRAPSFRIIAGQHVIPSTT
jgi:hypothetical protein